MLNESRSIIDVASYFSKGLRAIWLGSEVGFCF